jgi:hypothetical protein
MTRMYSPSPTVPSSRTPLYMQGFPNEQMLAGLGQDDGSGFDFTPPPPDLPIVSPLDPSTMGPSLPGDVFTYSPGFTPGSPIIAPAGAFDPNPLDYTSQQAAIAAGVPPATAAAAWANPAAYGGGGVPGNSSAAQISQAVAASARAAGTIALGPGASPRVRVGVPGLPDCGSFGDNGVALCNLPGSSSSFTSLLTASSIIPGVPNIVILGGALIALMAAGKR